MEANSQTESTMNKSNNKVLRKKHASSRPTGTMNWLVMLQKERNGEERPFYCVGGNWTFTGRHLNESWPRSHQEFKIEWN